jgi:thiamine biosynthesis protein ThiI
VVSSTDRPSAPSAPTTIVVHYHEIALKGRNRPLFVARLVRNIERATGGLPVRSVRALPGRLLVELLEPSAGAAWPELRERLAKVVGIANFFPAYSCKPEMETLTRRVVEALRAVSFESFRVSARRVNKQFPLNSMEIERALGRAIQDATRSRVDLGSPQLTVGVEVLPRSIFFHFEMVEGLRGMPVGTGGKVVSLISGGIDSPVAAWRMMRRGCRVSFVHFHSVPFLTRASQEKVKQLVELLTLYQYDSRLYLVAFGDLQRQVMLNAGAPLRVVLYRRFMMRIGSALGVSLGARALVTGESLGQVASQTLTNLAVIEKAASLPVLRPLIGMDKDEITAQARALGTYEISIQPDQDCCQLFIPAHPATSARLEEVEAAEGRLDVSGLVQQAVASAEERRFCFPSRELSAPAQPERALVAFSGRKSEQTVISGHEAGSERSEPGREESRRAGARSDGAGARESGRVFGPPGERGDEPSEPPV